MSHFLLVACLDDPDGLAAAMAPFDANRRVAPWRDYEPGPPHRFWAVGELRRAAGLNPDDATLTWAQVAGAWARWRPGGDRLEVDGDGRAYTLTTANPDGRWSWWKPGWAGHFPVRPGAAGALTAAKPATDGRLWCTGGPRSALDLDALRDLEQAYARTVYAAYLKATAGTPPALPWSHYAARVDAGAMSAGEASERYRAQPRVRACHEAGLGLLDDPVETFAGGEALHAARARAAAVPGYAVLTRDGRWLAPGQIGAFGTSSDTIADRIGYWEVANTYLDALPGDTHLIAVDCHN